MESEQPESEKTQQQEVNTQSQQDQPVDQQNQKLTETEQPLQKESLNSENPQNVDDVEQKDSSDNFQVESENQQNQSEIQQGEIQKSDKVDQDETVEMTKQGEQSAGVEQTENLNSNENAQSQSPERLEANEQSTGQQQDLSQQQTEPQIETATEQQQIQSEEQPQIEEKEKTIENQQQNQEQNKQIDTVTNQEQSEQNIEKDQSVDVEQLTNDVSSTVQDYDQMVSLNNKTSKDNRFGYITMPSFRKNSAERHSALQGLFVTRRGRLMTADDIHQSCLRLSSITGQELIRTTSLPVQGGTCSNKMHFLDQGIIDEMVDRLYKSKPNRDPPGPRHPVTLKVTHDQNGRPQDTWNPIKTVSSEEQTAAMIALYDKCHEDAQKKEKTLEEKYLQPLCKIKKIEAKDKATHMEKIEKLYKGLGVTS